MDARRSNWDGLQGGFCNKYRDICKKTNAADRPIRVIARRDELIRASLVIKNQVYRTGIRVKVLDFVANANQLRSLRIPTV